MVQEQPIGFQQPVHGVEVERQILQAHVLEHADARHLVIELAPVEVAVIPELHRDPILEPRLRDPESRNLELLGAQGDAVSPHTVVAGRMDHQGSPSAPDVEESFTRPQQELPADVLELRLLGVVEAAIRLLEVGAGVDHGPIQP